MSGSSFEYPLCGPSNGCVQRRFEGPAGKRSPVKAGPEIWWLPCCPGFPRSLWGSFLLLFFTNGRNPNESEGYTTAEPNRSDKRETEPQRSFWEPFKKKRLESTVEYIGLPALLCHPLLHRSWAKCMCMHEMSHACLKHQRVWRAKI